ncbi:MAG: ATP-binding cassette domain-containing protein [Bdellovibrionota bacterium]
MISLVNIAKQYGAQTLFKNVSITIPEKAKIGVLGRNGAGKSTFFKILAQTEPLDQGQIQHPKSMTMAWMRQDWMANPEDTILESTLKVHHRWYETRQNLQDMRQGLEKNHTPEWLRSYEVEEEKFMALGSDRVISKAKEILMGLGFSSDGVDKKSGEFSGGWLIRAHLAGVLLQEADLLLLDEPTNHLDMDSVLWFENYIKTYPGAFLLITHDRLLLKRVSEQIIELLPPKMYYWPGKLDKYEEAKQQKFVQLESEIKSRQKKVAQMEDFARKFKAKASKARQAQSKLKSSQHIQKQIEELMEDIPPDSTRMARFSLKLIDRLPKVVLQIEHACFGYDSKAPLFSLQRCMVEKGKKIGLIGVNGVGKSTFLKTCAGELKTLEGEIKVAENVRLGFYAQHRMEDLPLQMKGKDYLFSDILVSNVEEVFRVAGNLGLNKNDLEKDIEVLSGGEKARLSLSKILLRKPGLLLLDEPTNHLDLESCDALANGLNEYEGTVVVVSHNRDFLDGTVDQIYEIKDNQCNIYHGNYSYYQSQISGEKGLTSTAEYKSDVPRTERKNQKRVEAEERKERYENRSQIRKKLKNVEQELEEKKHEAKELDQYLIDPQSMKEKDFGQKVQRRQYLESRIENLETQWLELSANLEEDF